MLIMTHKEIKKAKFKSFKDITAESGWQFKRDSAIGQRWQYDDGLCTNRYGVGFTLPRNTKTSSIEILVDELNRRDYLLELISDRLMKTIDELDELKKNQSVTYSKW